MYDNDLNRLVNHVSLTFQKLSRWCIENKLTITMEKTNFVLFHTRNEPLVRNVREIATENMVINRVDAVKYLGITIDGKLTWNAHVEYVCNSLIKFFGIFKQLRHKVTTNIVRQLYHAFIYSKIKYGIEVYGNTSSRNISKLQVMQNKLLKYVMRFDIRTGTNFLHTTLDIMKVEDIHKNNMQILWIWVSWENAQKCLISIFEWKNHTLRNKTGRESRYAIPQNRIRCSISESSRS